MAFLLFLILAYLVLSSILHMTLTVAGSVLGIIIVIVIAIIKKKRRM